MRPRALAVLLASLAALATAGPAAAEGTFVFSGRGFGHGVGMSQYGARGAAEAGWDAPRILGHYYRGTELTQQPDRQMRVLLRPSVGSVTVTGTGLASAPVGGGPRSATGDRVTVRAVGGRVEVVSPAESIVVSAEQLELGTAVGDLALDGMGYRGVIELRPVGATRLQVVNRLDLESYLYGVVPREMPAGWPEQALQAQAIAARSYAIGQLRPARAFDVYADTRSQVYGGRDGEHPRTTAAVDATRGLAVTHQGAVATTFFHSTSGGHTESVEYVWGSDPRPYLVGVADPFDTVSPYHRWADPPRFSGSTLASRLGVSSPVTSVRVAARGVSPRVRWVEVTSADGSVATLTGATVRARLGLRDTWFSVNGAAPPGPPSGAGAALATPSVRYLTYAAAPASRARADALRRRLLRSGKDVVIVRRALGGVARHLVVTGHFRELVNARREWGDLRRRGYRSARIGSATARAQPAQRRYLVSAGVRRSRRAARGLAARLRADGEGVRIVVRRRGAGRVFLVVTGRYRSLARARIARDELRARGYRGVMVGPARQPA